MRALSPVRWLRLLPMAALVPLALRADNPLPTPQPASRYDQMANRSPFTAPTAPVPVATPPPPPPGPHWWDQMVVTSLMQKGGISYAAVIDRQNNKRYLLESGRPDEESHLLLVSVQWADRTDQTTVTVRKDAEAAPPLRFDPTTASVPTAPASVGPGPALFPNPAMTNRPVIPGSGPGPSSGNNNVVRRAPVIPARPTPVPPGQVAPRRPLNAPNGQPQQRRVVPAGADDDDDD